MELAQQVNERLGGGKEGRSFARRTLPVAAGIAAVVAACAGWAFLRFGSLRDAWLYAGGARVVIDRSALALPTGKVGDTQTAEFRLRNLTSRPVKVLGATVSCDCVTTEGLPAEVAAGGSLRLRSSVHLDGRVTGPFQQSVTYYTDHPAAPSLRAVIQGNVLAPETEGGADHANID
jgi:hypothetical protein